MSKLPDNILVSWDNESGIDVKELQKRLRRKQGLLTVEIRQGALALLLLNKPPDNFPSDWATAWQPPFEKVTAKKPKKKK